jgi:hypothetical protein
MSDKKKPSKEELKKLRQANKTKQDIKGVVLK